MTEIGQNSEILICQNTDRILKIDIRLENEMAYTDTISGAFFKNQKPLLANILSVFLKKGNCREIQLFGISEQMQLIGRKFKEEQKKLLMIQI